MKIWYRVHAAQYDFDKRISREIIIAKFNTRIDADIYGRQVNKQNPTWRTRISEGR